MIIQGQPQERREPTRRICRDVRSPLLDLHRSRRRHELALCAAFALCMSLGVMIGLAIAADRKAEAKPAEPPPAPMPRVHFRIGLPAIEEPPREPREWTA